MNSADPVWLASIFFLDGSDRCKSLTRRPRIGATPGQGSKSESDLEINFIITLNRTDLIASSSLVSRSPLGSADHFRYPI